MSVVTDDLVNRVKEEVIAVHFAHLHQNLEWMRVLSKSIVRYLANKAAADHLYPKDAKLRANVNELLDFDIGTLFATG